MAEDRFALIDLGSNSVRLVLFDRAKPFAAPLINEKSVVELARDLEETGKLSADRMEAAFDVFLHFKWLLDGLDVSEIHILATAAVRDAKNAKELIEPIESIMQSRVRILAGTEEANFAAKGVLLTCPGAEGLVADLGGGSLELAKIKSGLIDCQTSLPLGVLRLESIGVNTAKQVLKEAFKKINWLKQLDETDQVYLVGGTWRALATAHMVHKAYPLNVLHRYTTTTKTLRNYTKQILVRSSHRIDAMASVPVARRQKLPWAALVANKLAKEVSCQRVVFSQGGLREGYSAPLLGREQELKQNQATRYDKAIAALIPDGGRFGAADQALFEWMSPLFDNEDEALKNRRRQACQLFDFGWEAHPSYRNIDIPSSVLHSATLTQAHRDRAYLGLVLLLRHGGNPTNRKEHKWLKLVKLLSKTQARHAHITGRALRLAYKISRGIAPLVGSTSLQVENLTLRLKINEEKLWTTQDFFKAALRNLSETLALEHEIILVEDDS